MKRIVMMRSNPVNPNPAVEKAASALVEKGYKVTVLGWDRSAEYDEKRDMLKLSGGSAEIIRFGIPAVFSGGIKKNLSALIKFQKKLRDWLSDNRGEYDIIHAFDLDTGLTAKSMAKRYKKGFVYQIQDFYAASRFKEDSLSYKLIKTVECSVINKADATIICTEARKKQIEGSRPKNLTVVHNTPGYIASEEIEKYNFDSERMKIVYVGCFEECRFIRELISCVMEDSRFELHIGGFGLIEDYIKNCAQLCDRIVFYGKIPYATVLSLESSCDIMTAMYAPGVANHKYTAPNKLYESLMLKKPVIMCKNTGWDEVIETNDIGVLIEPSIEGLRAGLNTLYTRRSDWKEMGERGKKLYDEKYSWNIMKNRVQSVYAAINEVKA